MRVAGRTDAGVHATAQVVHIDLTPKQLKRLGRTVGMMGSLNDLLPDDIRIHNVTEAPEGFDARYSASYRRYRYTIADKVAPKNPLSARSTLWIKHELDLVNMQASALGLVGLHDFASFCRPKLGATTIREVRELTVARNPAAGNVIEVEIKADAFCHNMVRAIVGALIAAGEGKTTPDGVIKRLEKRSRVGSFKVQPPHGLTLIEVGYPPNDQLAAQAEMAKNLRTLDEN
jgi:tRNA pseudouridine38-40 synthase